MSGAYACFFSFFSFFFLSVGDGGEARNPSTKCRATVERNPSYGVHYGILDSLIRSKHNFSLIGLEPLTIDTPQLGFSEETQLRAEAN